MDVLVIGANGQLGRALLASVPASSRGCGLDRAALDLRDADRVPVLIEQRRPDVVINAAAYTQVDQAEDDEEAAFAVNSRAVGALAAATRAIGARLVHLSTDFVFDGESTRAYRPDDAMHPLSVYGRSKATGENLAGSDALIVRTAWVYAATGANFVNTMLRLMRAREEIRVVADQIGAPTWAPRLAAVVWRLIEARQSGLFHYTDAGVASWYDFAVAIAEEAAAQGLLLHPVRIVPVPTVEFPTRARRPRFSLLDSSAALDATGLAPVHWRTSLRRALAEIKAGEERAVGD